MTSQVDGFAAFNPSYNHFWDYAITRTIAFRYNTGKSRHKPSKSPLGTSISRKFTRLLYIHLNRGCYTCRSTSRACSQLAIGIVTPPPYN